jgi:hypothetical protein
MRLPLLRATSNQASALDDANQDDDHGGHKENMDEPTHGVGGEESKCPECDENDGDCPEHELLLSRNDAVSSCGCVFHPKQVPGHPSIANGNSSLRRERILCSGKLNQSDVLSRSRLGHRRAGPVLQSNVEDPVNAVRIWTGGIF